MLQPALAQTSDADTEVLEEVVVTATRQSDSVNRVAVAVTARTQEALDQRGVQDIADLQAIVPGLRITERQASGNVTIAIRNVRQQTGTAATTGFYVDEIPLAKRSAASFGAQNGTPVPPLFDLERLEVLRGPQGTLFGAGSEGGTIRYIQARPGLTEYSGYARAQWMTTKGGDPSHEVGVAFGGPIIQDKLGFRASLFTRETGGYIDLTDYRDLTVYDEDANHGKVRMGRLAVTWAPSENTDLTLSFVKSRDQTHSLGSSYNLPEPGQLVVPDVCFNIPFILNLPQHERAFLLPSFNPFDPVGAIMQPGPACNNETGAYVAPGYTVGPFDLERFQSLALGRTPTRSDTQLGGSVFNWRLNDDVTLTAATSFTQDTSRGQSPQNFPLGFYLFPIFGGGAQVVLPGGQSFSVGQGSTFNPNVTATPDGLGLGALIRTNTDNRRNVFSQELRLANDRGNRLNYVVGVFFSNSRARVRQYAETSDEAFQQFSGMTIEERYGVPFDGFFSNIFESIRDTEEAAFADLTYKITDQLHVSTGARVTHVSTSYIQSNYGPNGGTTSPSDAVKTGRASETPFTPKLSLQYFANPTTLVYATAAKGFRAGGVNQVLTSAADGTLWQLYRLTTDVLPKTYGSDSVWNYELGAKAGFWDGRAQVNAAIYQLDWKNMQQYWFSGDGAVFNVPKAESRGIEVEAQVRPVRQVTLNATVTNTKAKIKSDLIIPHGEGATNDFVITQKGQKFFQPDWTVDAGVRYDFNLGEFARSYVRADIRWFDSYLTAVPGTAQYSPDSSKIPSQKSINLRMGFVRDHFDVNLFALNVTDEKKAGRSGGRSNCDDEVDDVCSVFGNYSFGSVVGAPTPRQIGLQVAWRP
jgi:outer membrane receptor protein involved in Fe transport